MLIKSLNFEDKRLGWKLENLSLDRFNLLVGASGVGKTRILKAIRRIANIANARPTRNRDIEDVSFTVTFEHEQQEYTWSLDTTSSDADSEVETDSATTDTNQPIILKETLTNSKDGELVTRDRKSFRFKDTELPQLNRSESALNLLEEPTVDLAQAAFKNYLLDIWEPQGSFYGTPGGTVDKLSERFPSLEELRRHIRLNVVIKALALQDLFPSHFNSIKQSFIDIFPSVEDIAVGRDLTQEPGRQLHRIVLKIKEHDVPQWVTGPIISSGMLRTLTHLIELTLAPSGSVLLIDEFENSLGVNCMGPITQFIISKAPEMQFIFTSHHPYIINNMPKKYWKVVRRKGGLVRATSARDIPALQGNSAQDDFTRLINSPEFEEGIAP